MLHVALALTVIGGTLTWLTGVRGSMTVAQGRPSVAIVTSDGERVTLPFEVVLDSFRIDYYPGEVAPREYTSFLHIGGRREVISMNRIARVGGYRFYQSGYTPRGEAVLSVNRDPWGIALTYCGYGLFVVSAVVLLVSPRGRFRRLLRGLAILGAVLVLFTASPAEAREVPVLSRVEADSLARRQVVYNNRVAPFGTLARDWMLKVTGRDSYGPFSACQVVGGWFVEPEMWVDEPMILIGDGRLADRLGVAGRKRISFASLFDGNGYRLQRLYGSVDVEMREAIVEADERVGLVMSLLEGKLIVPLSDDVKPLPRWRVELELFYNAVALSRVPFILCLMVGLLSLVAGMVWKRSVGSVRIVTVCVLLPLAVWQTGLFAARWIVAGHVPLGNGYETMLFMAMAVLWLSAWVGRRLWIGASMGLLLAGFVLLVARLSGLDPQVSPLMPVLASPWLTIHVSVIMASYALLAFTFISSIVGLTVRTQQRRIARLAMVMLYPGEMLLGVGIILGAVWANLSWGRYWAWDPKETWALVTFVLYAAPFHSRFLPFLRHPRPLLVYLAVAFAAVVMTYFGVNHLGGMHAYG